MSKNTDLANYDSGLPVANLTATGTISVGSNVTVNTSVIFVGNSTVNTVANSSTITVGTSIVNSTVIAAGANVILNTSSISIGNSTVNTVTNSSTITVGTSVINSTVIAAGANVIMNTSTIFVGNSSVNSTANSTGFFLNGLSAGGFPSGTVMLFVQTAAPTGWTKSTTHNDKALRVVSGTASNGGSVAFSTAFASQAVSGTVGLTTLSSTQMPAHIHGNGMSAGSGGGVCGTGSLGAAASTGSAGGGGSHDHTFSGTAINLAVNYVDTIIATKN